ncbi:MAG: TatD family nuclease-associated radical SAM protein [Acidiferrobacterales bacterium]|nr:TatD family nuclease-associated radical SAM protein [Acidiferrobacterales bacterium]
MREEYQPIFGYSIDGDRYLNITNRCTLQCEHCPKFSGDWGFANHNLRLLREPTVSELVDAVGNPSVWNEVVFSGFGEPTLRLYDVLEVSRRVHERGGRVRLETDGLANLFFGRDITPDLEGNVDTLVVGLKAHNSEAYERLCRPKMGHAYEAVLDFTERARNFVPKVVVTAMSGVPDVDLEACRDIARRLDVGFVSRAIRHNC